MPCISNSRIECHNKKIKQIRFIFENLRFTVVEATKTYVEKVKIECLTKQVKDET